MSEQLHVQWICGLETSRFWAFDHLCITCFFFVCWDFSDETWHLLQFGVGIHSACRWERTNFAFGCEDNYECVCRMSEWKHVDWKLLDAEPTSPLIFIFHHPGLGLFLEVPEIPSLRYPSLSQVTVIRWVEKWQKNPRRCLCMWDTTDLQLQLFEFVAHSFSAFPALSDGVGEWGGEWNRISCHGFQRHEKKILR